MSFLKEDNRVLVILDNEISINDITDFSAAIKKRLKNPDQLITVSTKELEKCSNSSSHEVIVSIFTRTCPKPEMFLEECLRILKPVGTFIIYELIQQEDHPHSAYDKRTSSLKLAGFRVKSPNELNTKELKECLLNVYKDVSNICEIVAEKPSFEIGSSVTLNFGEKKSANVWKLDSDDDEELIDENDLLDEDDIVKPDATSLRVCSTTGKRKACKDCTCGLAEELSGKVALEDTAKSSCGNCYLGDAFRCSACPYLGMPAFKPGEKIVLPASQLKVD